MTLKFYAVFTARMTLLTMTKTSDFVVFTTLAISKLEKSKLKNF